VDGWDQTQCPRPPRRAIAAPRRRSLAAKAVTPAGQVPLLARGTILRFRVTPASDVRSAQSICSDSHRAQVKLPALLAFFRRRLRWSGSQSFVATGGGKPYAACKEAKESKGYSLHLGLNAVDPAHYGGWDGKLNACEADAKDMAAIAKALGYTESTVLLTRDATSTRFISEMLRLATALKSGDILLLSYSGHGDRFPMRRAKKGREWMKPSACLTVR
jgi:hypothetical protein